MFEKTKRPTEIVPVTIDYTGALPSGETVSASSTVTAATSAGVDATSTVLTGQSNTTTHLSIVLKATSAGYYLLTFTAITSPSAYKIIEEMQLTVI